MGKNIKEKRIMQNYEKLWNEEKGRLQLLGDALHSILITDGVLSEDSNPTYPELLMAADEYTKEKET